MGDIILSPTQDRVLVPGIFLNTAPSIRETLLPFIASETEPLPVNKIKEICIYVLPTVLLLTRSQSDK